MNAKTVVIMMILFIIVFQVINAKEIIQISNDLKSESISKEEISEIKSKYSEMMRKNITLAEEIQSEQLIYEILREEIDVYNANRALGSFLIYPGTKWCGAGDNAWSYNDLGMFRRVDMCCRDHDFCPDTIKPMSSKYGLTNNATMIMVNHICWCEEKFYACMKAISSAVARDIGDIYFNILGIKCYKEEYPIVRCKSNYTADYFTRCKEYEFDTTQPKKYQFFDNLIY